MNKIISNIARIASAAEYFDKQTSAAWRIRSTLTNMAVWAANAHVYAIKSMDVVRIAKSSIKLATLRVWMDDCNTSGLVLDFTRGTVFKTLGLNKEIDIHEEACREARAKCIRSRNAASFKQFYHAAASALEERRREREQAVEEISNLLSDNQMYIEHEVADYMEAHMHQRVGSGLVDDKVLYDDGAVEPQADQLAEAIGNVLEAMWDRCDVMLAAAITDEKIQRLLGYQKGINSMMDIAGVNRTRVAERRAMLEAQINAEMSDVAMSVKDMDADIAKQLAEIAADPTPQPEKRRAIRVKKAAA
jgi:hypothetical protein